MPGLSRLAPPLLGLLALAALIVSCTATPARPATALDSASASSHADAEKYYGIWNYDQPDDSTGNNIDVLACPDGGGQCDPALPLPLRVPQIGWVVFSPGPNGTVNGHTDQGCTWNFTVHPTGLELSSTTQQCFNPSVGSTGNLTKWSVQVDGAKETESIVAISHQPNGVDIIGTMNSGSRTKVSNGEQNNQFVPRFLGDFSYNPADIHTLSNIVVTNTGTASPEQGTVHIERTTGGKIDTHTPDGCDWTMAVRGNTAELDPASQTCHTANGDISLHYWALTSDDGQHMNGFRAGSTTAEGQPPVNTYLYVGRLTRSPSPTG